MIIIIICLQLAWRTDVQERLREEIGNMITETDNDYNVDHVEKLKYLDMVVSGMTTLQIKHSQSSKHIIKFVRIYFLSIFKKMFTGKNTK